MNPNAGTPFRSNAGRPSLSRGGGAPGPRVEAMPPRVVICELCGGKFFPHSIDKHRKVCRDKVGVQLHPCPYCQAGVPMSGSAKAGHH